MAIKSRKLLCDYVNRGGKVEYLCFWGHWKQKTGVAKSCLSQWYDAPFEAGGVIYKTAEHYMMAKKAQLFGDIDIATKVIAAAHPRDAKKLGRNIREFNEKIWTEHKFGIVIDGNVAKFGQHPELKKFLLDTGDKVLVEASPTDRIWGVGLAADDPAVENLNLWKGLNLLGFALMEVREQLAP